ncbi:class E sortase [Kribbella sp. NBC_01245]|uniref:class E sortase n=1 Tax=Kribbella sp. NBC_01245 TaxID=2903578 RepID=UPI002E285DD3|nr:class E sortase [Kribbella sp. NBC_01245]
MELVFGMGVGPFLVVAVVGAAALLGCSDTTDSLGGQSGTTTTRPATSGAPKTPTTRPPEQPSSQPSKQKTGDGRASAARPNTAPAVMAIPRIGVAGLRVTPYQGTADDGPGTKIQSKGIAANPQGAKGGVGAGDIGNYLVTAHRLSAGGPFRELPSLRNGDHVYVTAGGSTYDYVISQTMWISFRKPADLARQSAPVPGFPGRTATKAMITLSTCATIEDHAAGNFWKDEFDNPEHRIDKVGVLVGVKPA